MDSDNGQAVPVPLGEIGSGDAEIHLERLKLTDSNTFQVLAAQMFYGDEKQRLASPVITFTVIENNKSPSGTSSVINVKMYRDSDEKVIDFNLAHSTTLAMTLPSDHNMCAVMVLRIPACTSLAFQHKLQMGIQYERVKDNLPATLDGLYGSLTFALKSWPNKPGMYVSVNRDGTKEFYDYKAFLEYARECEKLREGDDERISPREKVILQRSMHLGPYFNAISNNELDMLLDQIGLEVDPKRDREGNACLRLREDVADTEDEGIGSSNETQLLEPRRVPSKPISVPGSSPQGVVLRSAVAKSVSPTKPILQKGPGGHATGAVIRIVHPPDGKKQVIGLVAKPHLRTAAVVTTPKKAVAPAVAGFNVAPSTSQVERPPPVPPRAVIKKPEAKKEKGPVCVALDDDDVSQDSTASTSATSSGTHTPAVSTPEPQLPTDFTEDTLMLNFPKNAHGSDVIHIRGKDMQRIAITELLNDSIIEFGIKYIFHRLHDEKLRSSTHIFSTFFFSSFAPNPPTDKQGVVYLPQNKEKRNLLLKKTYEKMKRWTRKTDIFKKKYIVVPVNSEMHWFLVIIVNPGKALRNKNEPAEDAATADPEDLCQVYLFDSLPDPEEPKRSCILPIMREYLKHEFEDKKKKVEPDLYFSSQHVCQIRVNGLPVQKNLVDCGVYLLAYLEFFFDKPPKVPQSRVVEMSEWCRFFRIGYIEFYRDKIIARIKGLCAPQTWSAFINFEREAHKKDPQTPRVTVYNEADLVDLGRRPRRHECYSCPDPVKPEPVRPRSVSLPAPGVLVPALNRVKHRHD